MWISRISLRNFKSYRYQTFEFPKPENDKNLALIGGVNGYGKTTLLEAIYVGLYGEEAVNHKALDRAGLKARGYGHFLENALYKHALRDGQDSMEVSIEIIKPERGAFKITRKWFFTNAGRYNDQRLIINEKLNSATAWKTLKEEELPILLTVYAVPPWLAPFFFFDGEKIAALADEDRTGWVLTGLESLSGVVLVKELRQKLAEYSTKKMREQGGVDEQKVSELKDAVDEAEQKIYQTKIKIGGMDVNLKKKWAERESLTQKLSDLAQGIGFHTTPSS
jgi:DNA sulfur modification protein DndD